MILVSHLIIWHGINILREAYELLCDDFIFESLKRTKHFSSLKSRIVKFEETSERNYKRLEEDFTWVSQWLGKTLERIAELEKKLEETKCNDQCAVPETAENHSMGGCM